MALSRLFLLIICLIAMAGNLRGAEPMTVARARHTVDSIGADPLGGIWRMGPDGATIAILPTPSSQGHFEIYLLDSPDMSVIPGQIIGSASATGSYGTYDAEFSGTGKLISKRQRFILTLSSDGSLGFKSYKKGKKISLWRWLPYLFRFSVSDYDTRPSAVDGAVRLYPSNGPTGPTLL